MVNLLTCTGPFFGDKCPRNGKTSKNGQTDPEMPDWPFIGDEQINPAYIFRKTSPHAYAWPRDYTFSEMHCRNSDYRVTFCKAVPGGADILPDSADGNGDGSGGLLSIGLGFLIFGIIAAVILMIVGVLYYKRKYCSRGDAVKIHFGKTGDNSDASEDVELMKVVRESLRKQQN